MGKISKGIYTILQKRLNKVKIVPNKDLEKIKSFKTFSIIFSMHFLQFFLYLFPYLFIHYFYNSAILHRPMDDHKRRCSDNNYIVIDNVVIGIGFSDTANLLIMIPKPVMNECKLILFDPDLYIPGLIKGHIHML